MPSSIDTHDDPECLGDTPLSVRLRTDFVAYDFVVPVPSRSPATHSAASGLYRLSEAGTLRMWRGGSMPTDKCIYPRLPLSSRNEAREHDFLAWVQNEPAVQALGRIVRQHRCLRRAVSDGGARYLVPDFLVRTPDATYLVDVHTRRNPPRRLHAMMDWCDWANGLPAEQRGERAWFFAPLAGLPLRDWRRNGGRLCELLAIARIYKGYVARSGHAL